MDTQGHRRGHTEDVDVQHGQNAQTIALAQEHAQKDVDHHHDAKGPEHGLDNNRADEFVGFAAQVAANGVDHARDGRRGQNCEESPERWVRISVEEIDPADLGDSNKYHAGGAVDHRLPLERTKTIAAKEEYGRFPFLKDKLTLQYVEKLVKRTCLFFPTCLLFPDPMQGCGRNRRNSAALSA